MPRYSELSLSAQTAYAQLFDATLASEPSRSVGSLRAKPQGRVLFLASVQTSLLPIPLTMHDPAPLKLKR
jgi:hypothetical protein